MTSFFFGPASSSTCKNSLQAFLLLAESLNLPIKHSKTVLPSTSVQLHGILVDTEAMSLLLPEDKLATARRKLDAMCRKKKTSLRELQSLIGTLGFACKAIVPGRTFLRRLHDLTAGGSKPHHSIRLNKEARADLNIWRHFLTSFNGRVICLPDSWENSDTLKLFSDASKAAMAAVLGSAWIQLEFPSAWQDVNIAVKEFLPILLAVQLWASRLRDRRIMFYTDNAAVVSVINKQTAKDKHLMSLVRSLVLTTLSHNILFKAKHIPGYSNVIPDLLSRRRIEKAQSLAPWLDKVKTPIPDHFVPW